MKALNFIDLAVQTFLLGAVALLSLAIGLTGSLESIGMIALYGALFLGPWQLVSSLVTTLSKGLYLRWRLIHLVSSCVYLAALIILASLNDGSSDDGIVEKVGGVIGFVIPALLALFYYFITVKSFQLARAKTK